MLRNIRYSPLHFSAESEVGYRRDATRVMYDLLCLARDRVSKTQMVYRANLNFRIVNGYISFLLCKAFIMKNHDGCFLAYELTERGHRVLDLLEELYSPSLLSYPGKSNGTTGRAG